MSLTVKQQQILAVIVKGNPDGSFCDLDEILERLPYETTKQSLQFSIRALVCRALIEKHEREIRRGRRRVVISATKFGYDLARPKPLRDLFTD